MTSTATRPSVALAGDVMSAPPLTVRPETSVWAAWTLMTHHGVRHLLVTEHGRCLGVLDDRSIFAQWPLGPAALHRKPVALVMCTPAWCVRTDSELRGVAAVMLRAGAEAVPVVDENGLTVGVITCSDILAVVARPADGTVDPDGDAEV